MLYPLCLPATPTKPCRPHTGSGDADDCVPGSEREVEAEAEAVQAPVASPGLQGQGGERKYNSDSERTFPLTGTVLRKIEDTVQPLYKHGQEPHTRHPSPQPYCQL